MPTADEIKPEERMRIFMLFQSKKNWTSVREELNERRHDTDMAQLINDMGEDFRKEALRQLDQNHIFIDRDWEILQQKSLANKRNDVFPLVATRWLLKSLPDSMIKCNVCGDSFVRGDDIIKKACGKHSMHRICLIARLNENEVPLYGPCGCNNGGYGTDLWRLLTNQTEDSDSEFLSPPPQAMDRVASPLPWVNDFENHSPYETSEDSHFTSCSDSSSDPNLTLSASSSSSVYSITGSP